MRSPLALQNMAVSTYGYVWRRRRFGGVFGKECAGFRVREGFSEQQFQDYQTIALRKILLHAFHTVPFYHAAFSASGWSDSMLQKFELNDLPRLPFLEKNDLRKHGIRDLLSTKREAQGRFFNSSGSTGTPVQILFSNAMHQRWTAAMETRVRNWAGLDRHEARGTIGGRRISPEGIARHPFYRYNSAERQVYFSAYHIAPANTASYLEGITRHGVQYMTGYAVSNYLLAKQFELQGLSAPKLKAVLTSSEPLTAEMRAQFQRTYQCRTFDAWSGVEACGLVSECEKGSLHISPDVGILEFLDPQTGIPARPGALAEVVCTGLLNFDQPLIRYRIGDLMRLSETRCSCGREMPVVCEITGRLEDMITGPDGRQMVRFHNIFAAIPEIREGQVIQHSLLDYEVRIVPDGIELNENHRIAIRQRMISQLGPVSVEIAEVQEIPRTSNGKFRSVISHVKPEDRFVAE